MFHCEAQTQKGIKLEKPNHASDVQAHVLLLQDFLHFATLYPPKIDIKQAANVRMQYVIIAISIDFDVNLAHLILYELNQIRWKSLAKVHWEILYVTFHVDLVNHRVFE